MTTLKFADTHNMVAFLDKPTESEGFEKIATVKAKTVNGEVQLQALVDGKKIIIIESIVRRDLQLEDAEGVDCLPNATIFEQLTLMGSKTIAWNKFSSTMASATICLATNQKFNFSKYIFESMVKNLDNVSGNFLMYPRNMRRVGKGFSRRDIPLFPTMMVQAQQEQCEGSAIPTDPQQTPTITQPSTSQPKKTQKPRKPKKNTEVLDDSLVRVATTASSLEAKQDSGVNTPRSDEDSMKHKELMEFCTKLQQRVLDLENTKTTQA
ncbi:hypothetical protein Tco_0972981 [Tanacetum coccineum]